MVVSPSSFDRAAGLRAPFRGVLGERGPRRGEVRIWVLNSADVRRPEKFALSQVDADLFSLQEKDDDH